jgi:hypothetical protein
MGAEFYIRFGAPGWRWRPENEARIEKRIEDLKTFRTRRDGIFELIGLEGRDDKTRWRYDVRLIAGRDGDFLMEVSAHPPSIECDISAFLGWLREETAISVEDDDGVPVNW